ncbi:MAG TPA: SIS domain-containing protein, partial [Caldimonas sp.]|nr:SIS domain-containing protein [Caldimonas sp.]
AMTVGRFLRSIGYGGIAELKSELRDAALSSGLTISGRLDRIRASRGTGEDLHRNLQLEVNALVGVYEQVGSPSWKTAVDRLARADEVFVAGFQTLAGMAADFAARLQYLRPGVRAVDGRDGTFADVFAGRARHPCVVLLEMRRYTRYSELLAKTARQSGVDLVVICDRHCHWARDHTSLVFTVDTDSTLFWDSQSPFVSLINLLLDHTVRRLRGAVGKRLEAMAALQEGFGAFE